jgi:hypothetical protein
VNYYLRDNGYIKLKSGVFYHNFNGLTPEGFNYKEQLKKELRALKPWFWQAASSTAKWSFAICTTILTGVAIGYITHIIKNVAP